MFPALKSRGVRLLLSLTLIGVIASFCRLTAGINNTTTALCLLLGILTISTWGDSVTAVSASVLAGLAFSYLLPPSDSFAIDDPQNWIALITFVTTAIIGSELSLRARRKATEALEKNLEIERLYALSRGLLNTEGGDTAERSIEKITALFNLRSAALYDAAAKKVFRAGSEPNAIPDDSLRACAASGSLVHDAASGIYVAPLTAGGAVLGSVGFCGGTLSVALVNAAASVIASGLERARANAKALAEQAARKNEQLKTTLLNALAHSLKTPLTSIKAAVTAILSGNSGSPAQTVELLTIVDEEADRLHELIAESLYMVRIDAGKLRLERRTCSMAGLVSGALKHFERVLANRQVSVDVPATLPVVALDGKLIEQALIQLVDNASKYSPPGSPLRIRAETKGESVVVSVANEGTGIDEGEREMIFEKFYRGRANGHTVEGTGMGLSIAKSIIEAHGGGVWVTSGEESGTMFHFSLPLRQDPAA